MEDVVVTIESSEDEADLPPGASGTRNGKMAANDTAHVGQPSMPPTTITPNENGLYACQDCHKTFASRDVLLLHATMPHTFACSLCAFTTTAKHLKRHSKKFCKKWRDRAERYARLGQSTELKKLWESKRDKRKRKGADAALLAGLQTCWRCSAVFRDKQSLDDHIRDSHEDATLKPSPRAVDYQQEGQASVSAPDVICLE